MYLVHVAATGPRQAEMQRERGPVEAKNPGARKLLGVLSCWWNFTVQRLRANHTHTHTHTHHPTVQSVSRCRHFSSLLFLLPGPLLSCFTWLGTRASSLPFLRRQREPVKTYNPPPPSSAQNPPMTASALRVKDKGLLWPWMNLPHHLSSPPRLYQPRCSWASQAYTLASGPLPWLFPLPGPLVPACLPSFQHGSLPPSPPSSFCSKGSFSALCLPSINPLKYGPLFTYPVSCLLSSLQWTRAVIFLFCSLQMLPGT